MLGCGQKRRQEHIRMGGIRGSNREHAPTVYLEGDIPQGIQVLYLGDDS